MQIGLIRAMLRAMRAPISSERVVLLLAALLVVVALVWLVRSDGSTTKRVVADAGVAIASTPASSSPPPIPTETLPEPFDALYPLATRKRAPLPGDWLSEHREQQESFAAYRDSLPIRPDPTHTTLYVQVLGPLSPGQHRAVVLAAEYMHAFFQLPVKLLDPLPASAIPESARRIHPKWLTSQLHTGYVLDSVLAPRRPSDAVAYIAFTAEDLYPEEGWNFVFGQASFTKRVGVWSIHRFGEPDGTEEERLRFLRRTLRTAVHETGHMLSIPHCVSYECVMNGTNHLEETDTRPMDPCPVCLAKISWNIGFDPARRFEELEAFAATNGLAEERSYWSKARSIMSKRSGK